MVKHERDSLIDQVSHELADLQAANDDSDRALADYLGVHRTDLRCLDLITRQGPRTAGDIARALRLSPSSVTALLDRLERAGYAQRLADPRHGKRVLAAPTQKLADAVSQLLGQRIRDGQDALSAYDQSQLRLLRDFLRDTRTRHADFARRLHDLTPPRAQDPPQSSQGNDRAGTTA